MKTYLIIDIFNGYNFVTNEDGEIKELTWGKALKEALDCQEALILDVEESKLYTPVEGMREPKKKEWRVYYLPSGYKEDENNPEPEFRTRDWEEWLKDHEDTELYTLKEFQTAFNSAEINDTNYLVIDKITIL